MRQKLVRKVTESKQEKTKNNQLLIEVCIYWVGHGWGMGKTWVGHWWGVGGAWARHGWGVGGAWVGHGRDMGGAWVGHGAGLSLCLGWDCVCLLCALVKD